MQFLTETAPDREPFMKQLPLIFKELDMVKAGGYIPPDSNPELCEPPIEGDISVYQLRLNNAAGRPYDRCDRIACQVKDQCTKLVLEKFNSGK